MFLVVSQSDFQLGFDHPFLRARSGAQVKLRARKVGRLEKFCPPLCCIFSSMLQQS